MNVHASSAAPTPAPYDPTYDPILDPGPGEGRAYAPTYWIDTAGAPPEDDGPVSGDIDADVVVIGSGYTGLSCALHLAKEHGIKAHVLEANGVAWGCSTRNGGQAQISAGRLKRSEWISRWGLDVAQAMHREMIDAFEHFRSLIKEHGIACDPHDGGHYYIAHRASAMPRLKAEAALLKETFGYGARILTREELHETAVRDQEAHGAMWEPDGTSVHPARLAFGLARAARELGARIHVSSPVCGWTTRGDVHHLSTPGGTVRARRVAIATSAYTARGLHRHTRDRLLPVLSNSIVTRTLTEDELADCGIQTLSPLTDTRTLRHYYRRLPDNRVQIGSRSAITGRDAPAEVHLARLQAGLWRKFPALRNIPLDYSWWGWVDVSHDMMPRITRPDPAEAIWYALGYGGNGVMYSAQAGRRMAEMVAGRGQDLTLPIFTGELKHEGLLTPFRRLGQRWLYQWYWLKDEYL